MKDLKEINLNDLSFIYPKHTIEIDNYKIPILVHIKDIKTSYEIEELEIGLIGKEDIFSYEYELIKLLNLFKSLLVHINIQDKLFDNFTKTFLENYKLKSVNDLLYKLNENQICKIVEHIKEIKPIMIHIFRKRLYSALKVDIKAPVIKVPKIEGDLPMPPDLTNYMSFNDFYITCQAIIEFNATPIFEENKNKAVSEWSLREIELHKTYLTRKHKVEELQNQWQLKVMHSKNSAK